MNFLIQKINNEIRHDFAFTLIESARFHHWLGNDSWITLKYLNTIEITEPGDIYPPFDFKHYHYTKKYVPIGSVEFVNEFLSHFYGLTLKPTNVPEVLFPFAGREIFNGNHLAMENNVGDYFVKSNDNIKGFAEFIGFNCKDMFPYDIPVGNYQYSKKIEIDSEWRAFVYENKLVGLQNYSGDFRIFPYVKQINKMIGEYHFQQKDPIAYTLDVCVNEHGTFVIECHPMVSVGLYGMSYHKILPYMFYKCFWEIVQKEGKYE